jgi:hypothetical protein
LFPGDVFNRENQKYTQVEKKTGIAKLVVYMYCFFDNAKVRLTFQFWINPNMHINEIPSDYINVRDFFFVRLATY